MKQFSNLQSHGLDRFEELSGAEAAQINGGSPESVDRQREILWDILEDLDKPEKYPPEIRLQKAYSYNPRPNTSLFFAD